MTAKEMFNKSLYQFTQHVKRTYKKDYETLKDSINKALNQAAIDCKFTTSVSVLDIPKDVLRLVKIELELKGYKVQVVKNFDEDLYLTWD